MTAQQPEARLLVVEDDPNIVELLAASLRYAGFEVMTARQGQQALTAAGELRPDLVVLDVMLPGIDGFELCRRIRASSGLPIILLTARGEEADRIVGLSHGRVVSDCAAGAFDPAAQEKLYGSDSPA